MRDWKKWLLQNLELPTMANGRDNRIIEELADHLEDMQGEALARGTGEAEAEAQVLAWLGDPAEAAKELLRCEPGELLPHTHAYARQLADDISPGSLRETKRQIYTDQHRDAAAAVRQANDLLERMTTAEDFREAVVARREKRSPRWTDR